MKNNQLINILTLIVISISFFTGKTSIIMIMFALTVLRNKELILNELTKVRN